MKIYVLYGKGVGANPPSGVFSTREKAEEAAKAIWPKTDGYHDLHIDEYELDVTYESAFPYGSPSGIQWHKDKPLEIRYTELP